MVRTLPLEPQRRPTPPPVPVPRPECRSRPWTRLSAMASSPTSARCVWRPAAEPFPPPRVWAHVERWACGKSSPAPSGQQHSLTVCACEQRTHRTCSCLAATLEPLATRRVCRGDAHHAGAAPNAGPRPTRAPCARAVLAGCPRDVDTLAAYAAWQLAGDRPGARRRRLRRDVVHRVPLRASVPHLLAAAAAA